ncbi:transcriptional regulator, Fis family / DNA-binding protein Fis [Rhodopseudomonas palustris HaA2]|uniref:Transcriptional regulator, Fis family / DNA-binding protein Fis n=1 Tax=Rhodopseudomonas palustris (strain HaA2) TaxID=316058 RepID=Q2ISX4_RHOP2|nr:transcriptional regulator PpsR [Rhodopseudomonas palustris]ABD08686.1 transcriptional regulator, Fis family / DNA-binding protein Fis [Rhodopseudomonas palustris HaA2]
MQVFKSPKESLGDLGAQSAAKLIAAATDVALVVDSQGVIRDVAFNKDELALELDGQGRWLESRLVDIVTSDTQPKIRELLLDATVRDAPTWRQVNHPSPGGDDVPVLYSAINYGPDDRLLVVGRDLRQLAMMQQRLINAQQSMERDYIRLRHAETRYRLLFQVSSEAVMIVDASSELIVDANPATLALFDMTAAQTLNSAVIGHFGSADQQVVMKLFGEVRTTGRDGRAKVRLASSGRECELSASLFRQENASLFLVRLTSQSAVPESGAAKNASLLLKYFEAGADALVITQFDGRVIRANLAFLEMAQLGSAEQARGQLLDRWLGRTGVDLSVALANLRQSGAIKLFATVLRGEYGAAAEVEVSAVALNDIEDKPCFGFAIRNVEKRLPASPSSKRELPRSVAQLTELIGRVPLRDLVRETTDVIEKLSIEAALELTGDNRASAADMLGLSRQSLYVKLRRYGLAEHAPEGEAADE